MKEFLEWSRSLGFDGQTAAELLNHMLDDSALDPELPCWISSPSYAMAAHGLGAEEQLRREGFLVIGSCPNGDPALVAFRDPKLPVYYLSHEELHCKPVGQIVRRVSDSIAAYDKALFDENAKIPLGNWDRKNGYRALHWTPGWCSVSIPNVTGRAPVRVV